MKTVARSLTKSIDLNACPKKVFDYIADIHHWPEYAIVNLKSVKKLNDEWFEIETVHGKGKAKVVTNAEFGILDTIWVDPNASWTVFCRVFPNGSGATLLNTFFKPPHFDDVTFESAMQTLDIEFDKLKQILEN